MTGLAIRLGLPFWHRLLPSSHPWPWRGCREFCVGLGVLSNVSFLPPGVHCLEQYNSSLLRRRRSNKPYQQLYNSSPLWRRHSNNLHLQPCNSPCQDRAEKPSLRRFLTPCRQHVSCDLPRRDGFHGPPLTPACDREGPTCGAWCGVDRKVWCLLGRLRPRLPPLLPQLLRRLPCNRQGLGA